MILPVRCFTCGKVVGNKWRAFCYLRKRGTVKDALDELRLRRYCCRIMFLCHFELPPQIGCAVQLPEDTSPQPATAGAEKTL